SVHARAAALDAPHRPPDRGAPTHSRLAPGPVAGAARLPIRATLLAPPAGLRHGHAAARAIRGSNARGHSPSRRLPQPGADRGGSHVTPDSTTTRAATAAAATGANPAGILLETRDLSVHFTARGSRGSSGRGTVRAVDRVSIKVPRGRTLG